MNQKIEKKTLGAIYAIIKQMDMENALKGLVSTHTHNRTESLGGMYQVQAALLLASLKTERKQICGKMWASMTYYMVHLGYTKADGKADYDRINEYIKNIGSRNPNKRIMAFLKPSECVAVLTQIQERYRTEFKKDMSDDVDEQDEQ